MEEESEILNWGLDESGFWKGVIQAAIVLVSA